MWTASFAIFATLNISDKGASAPVPISPQANFFTCGSTTNMRLLSRSIFQNDFMISSCDLVRGCSHMAVFIAGARINGLPGLVPWPKSHARMQHDSVSSLSPLAILANVCADSGAIMARSAQSRRSMCRTGSPSLLHPFHSSSALCMTMLPLSSSVAPGDCLQFAPFSIREENSPQLLESYVSALLTKFSPPRVRRTQTSAFRSRARVQASSGTFTAATDPVAPSRILGLLFCLSIALL
mmetsp:Transcript_4252/g.9044  ORF Transcript_4252/g.9044 Transcript_4252/m.9044 type:complete len:239 (+) Transcript_4252:58-774(+)